MKLSHSNHAGVDYFSIMAHPEVFYFLYHKSFPALRSFFFLSFKKIALFIHLNYVQCCKTVVEL